MAPGHIRPLVAGNWKMNGLSASIGELDAMKAGAGDLSGKADLMVCPPATLTGQFAAAAKGSALLVGGQDCHAKASGAHTGDISAEMLADAGATAVIVGHSERRTDHKETDADVNAKVLAAWRAGLTAIVCVGEQRAEREAGSTLTVIGRQLAGSLPDGCSAANLVVAYEPVWAIGTGLTPTPADVAEVHAFIRAALKARFHDGGSNARFQDGGSNARSHDGGSSARFHDGGSGARFHDGGSGVRILYGGSVKPSNAAELLTIPDVNGALVGGASLKAVDFLGIAAVYR